MEKSGYDICIIGGCGHVGLPLGIAFATEGKRVALYDINKASIAKVNAGEMPFMEEGADAALKKVLGTKRLSATNDKSVISKSDVLVLVIGTPVDEHLNPKLRDVMNAIKDIEGHLVDNQLLVLRSTLFPGVTDKIHNYLEGAGKYIDVAFCPERIAEGYALTELYELPQIVSGTKPRAVKRASELFSALTKHIVELTPIEAEMAKLFSNTWRYINFAISNQFYMIANDHGLDFYKIYGAMTKDYPRLKSFARAGFAAGPCLFKDTMQLSAFSGNSFFLGHAAMLVNESLPDYIVDQLQQKQNIDLSTKVVGVLGMAFKSESDDARESLSYRLRKRLEIEAREVMCTDSYIKDPSFHDVADVVEKSDIIIVATPHNEYKDLNLTGKVVVDIWNLFNNGGKI